MSRSLPGPVQYCRLLPLPFHAATTGCDRSTCSPGCCRASHGHLCQRHHSPSHPSAAPLIPRIQVYVYRFPSRSWDGSQSWVGGSDSNHGMITDGMGVEVSDRSQMPPPFPSHHQPRSEEGVGPRSLRVRDSRGQILTPVQPRPRRPPINDQWM